MTAARTQRCATARDYPLSLQLADETTGMSSNAIETRQRGSSATRRGFQSDPAAVELDGLPTEQARLISDARRLLRPSFVRLHHVPDWFRRLVLRKLGTPYRGATHGHDAVDRCCRLIPYLGLDHWGSTPYGPDGRLAFVSEPYGDAARIAAGQHLADRLGCGFEVDPNSYWFPGRTMRLVWYQLATEQQPNPVGRRYRRPTPRDTSTRKR